ncbi:MAG: rod shape-determining protein MreC [Actinomycetales bacterium]|nr:rod shape-determining protein MreC [Actinomycetales bacterium]
MKDSRGLRLVLALLLVASVTLVALDLRRSAGGPTGVLRSLGGNLLAPVQASVREGWVTVNAYFVGVGELVAVRDEVAQLQLENQRLRAATRVASDQRRRIRELDALLRVAGLGEYRLVPARVIATGTAQSFTSTVSIDAGRLDGIRPDMTVLNGDGLVGRTALVFDRSATVVLITDPESSVGSRLEDSGEIGFLTGTGRIDALDYRLLDPLAPIGVGDRLVTWGSVDGRPYVPGVPVGEVVDVAGQTGQLTRQAVIRPFVDTTRLDLIGVVIEPPRTDPRDAVLPQRGSLPAAPAPLPAEPSVEPVPGGSPTPGVTPEVSPRPSAPVVSPSPAPLASVRGP